MANPALSHAPNAVAQAEPEESTEDPIDRLVAMHTAGMQEKAEREKAARALAVASIERDIARQKERDREEHRRNRDRGFPVTSLQYYERLAFDTVTRDGLLCPICGDPRCTYMHRMY